jgi:hypothetical protein
VDCGAYVRRVPDEPFDALVRRWLAQIKPVPMLPENSPVLVHGPAARVDEHDRRRLGPEGLHTPLEEGRRAGVIVRSPLEELPSRELEDPVEVPGASAVLRAAAVLNPRIRAGVGAADLFGRIRRRVVRDDELEVGEGLAEQRVERFGEKALPVVDRKSNADNRLRRHQSHPRALAPIAKRRMQSPIALSIAPNLLTIDRIYQDDVQ